jgi:hypothetical protein
VEFLIARRRQRVENRTRKNRTLAGPVQFVGAGADITFQRGTTTDDIHRNLGGWATVHRQ